ncbi:MAG: type II secretion system F family protein [Candidatus Aminicenantes bacterium]|jgi:type IV pilus assembly protein PilC
MPVFVWNGKNRFGDVVGGKRVARSEEDLSRILARDQISGLNVKKEKAQIQIPFLQSHKVGLKDLALYSRQLSVLIDAELPLIQSLSILSEQTKNKYFQQVIQEVREDVEAGSSLNQAKRKFPRVFDDLYCNLVASGEQSGSLDVMLRRLAEYLEKIVKLRSQIKQAMTYPSAVLGFAILVVVFMMWKVVPVFASIFSEMGAQLPFLTSAILAVSEFIQKNIVFLFLGIVALFLLIKYARQTDPGRKVFDKALYKLPIFGGLLEKVGLSRVTRTLSTLLSGGVPMLECLKITSSTSGNIILENQIIQARTLVSEGSSLTEAFKGVGRFPYMFIQLMGVGEATGTLDEMLTKLADFYDDDVEASVSTMLSVLEPLLLVVVGGMVGLIVVSMYLPIFSLMQQL